MQKMLTIFDGFAGPPVVSAPAGEPCATIVRATSFGVNAPAVRCPQLVKPVTPEQFAFDVHDTAGFLNALDRLSAP